MKTSSITYDVTKKRYQFKLYDLNDKYFSHIFLEMFLDLPQPFFEVMKRKEFILFTCLEEKGLENLKSCFIDNV